MKRLSILAILFLCTPMLLCSAASKQGGRSGAYKGGSVSGHIVESSTLKSMGYATVKLHRYEDDRIINGAISDAEGKFNIAPVPPGVFYLEIKIIGYEKKHIDSLKFAPGTMHKDMGKVEVEISSVRKEAVKVSEEKLPVQYMADKKVVNVSQDLAAKGGTAVNALENVPSVNVDIEGNVSLRGSSNFTVFINGRPSILQGSDALKQIPADVIDNIEIITNPSAKYDPDGMAGIINVILKKDVNQGVNGLFSGSTGNVGLFNGNASINYRTDKMNFATRASYNNNNQFHDNHTESRTTIRDIDGTETDSRNDKIVSDYDMSTSGYNASMGMDYFFTEKSILTANAMYGKSLYNVGTDTKLNNFFNVDPTKSYSVTDNLTDYDTDFYNLSLNYDYLIEDVGHKLSAFMRVGGYDSDGEETMDLFATNADWLSTGDTSSNLTNHLADGMDYRLTIDYERPILNEGSLELGGQITNEDFNSKYTAKNRLTPADDWVLEADNSNTMDLMRQIMALYCTASNNFGFMHAKLGLRAEYTNRDLEFASEDKPYNWNQLDFFPTVHLSRQMGSHQLSLSYSRRIYRPHGRNLDPLPHRQDALNFRVGNPYLKPEDTDSYELGYQYAWGSSFVSADAFYKHGTNRIASVPEEDPVTGIRTHRLLNTEKDQAYGGEMMLNWQIFKPWRLNISGSVYKYAMQDSNIDSLDNSVLSWSMRMNSMFLIGQLTRIQLFSYYQGPHLRANRESDPFFQMGLAASHEFLDRTLRVTLSAQDILGTGKQEFVIDSGDLYQHSRFTWTVPMVSLSITYTLNNYQRRQSESRQDGGGQGGGGFDIGY